MSVPLPEVTTIVMGQSPPGSTYNERGEGLPFFQGKAEFGTVSPSPKKWCTEPMRLAETGDILLSVRAPVGPTNLAVERCCIGRGLAAIRADAARLDPTYLRFFLRYSEPRLANMGQGSTFAAIGRAEIASLRIPLPLLHEQRRIVDLLSRAEGILRLRREAQAKAQAIIPALFLDLFGDPATNPNGWPVSPIADLCAVQTGSTPRREERSYYDGGRIPWVKTGEVCGVHIGEAEEHITERAIRETNCKVFPVDTILVAMYGQGQTRGRAGLLKIPSATNQACAAILPSDKIVSIYLYELLKTQYERLRAMGRGGNQANLNLGMIKSFLVPCPPLDMQAVFVSQVAAMESICSQQTTALHKAQATFDALLARSFGAARL